MDAFVGKNEPSLFMESTIYIWIIIMSNQQLAVKKQGVTDHKRKHTPLQRIQKDMVDGLRYLERIKGSIDVAANQDL